MVSKPREVIINLDDMTVSVKTVTRAYRDKVEETENLNVKAASMTVQRAEDGPYIIPAMTLTLIVDGITIPQRLPARGEIIQLSGGTEKDSASQGHGWPGEDQGRDYGGRPTLDEGVKKRKDVPYY